MPPEILTDSNGMCCKSQDISSGIMELEKIRCGFGSRIASGVAVEPFLTRPLILGKAKDSEPRDTKQRLQARLLGAPGSCILKAIVVCGRMHS